MHDMLGVHAAQGRCIHAAHLLLERAVEQGDAAELALSDQAAHVHAQFGVPLRHLIFGSCAFGGSPHLGGADGTAPLHAAEQTRQLELEGRARPDAALRQRDDDATKVPGLLVSFPTGLHTISSRQWHRGTLVRHAHQDPAHRSRSRHSDVFGHVRLHIPSRCARSRAAPPLAVAADHRYSLLTTVAAGSVSPLTWLDGNQNQVRVLLNRGGRGNVSQL